MSPYFKACAQLASGSFPNWPCMPRIERVGPALVLHWCSDCSDKIVICLVSGSTVMRSMLCCTGQFVIALFVFVHKLNFTLSCLASIFFYIGMRRSRPFTCLLMVSGFVCKVRVAGTVRQSTACSMD